MLLRLVREHDVLLESFRPGVMDRLGVGYERLRAEHPGLVYCAITGYGQDGPDRDRPGHDLNYLARGGLLGLTGERGGPPVARRGPDRRPRRRRADGRVRDPRRAARARPLGRGPARRREHDPRRAELAGDGRGALLRRRRRPAPRRARAGRRARLLPDLRVRRRLGRARRARAEVLAGAVRGPRPRGPGGPPAATPRSPASWRRSSPRAPAPSGRRSTTRTRAASSRCWTSTRRSTAAPEAVVEVDAAGRGAPVRLLGPPVALSRTPPDGTRPGAGARRRHGRGAGRARATTPARSSGCKAAGAVAGPGDVPAGSFLA